MVVFRVYFARSIAGMAVAVGVDVSVGKGGIVAEGTTVAVGVSVGAGAVDVQEEYVKIKRKNTKKNGVILFRMCRILPLVVKNFILTGDYMTCCNKKAPAEQFQQELWISIKNGFSLRWPF